LLFDHNPMLLANSYRPDTYRGKRVLVTGTSGFIGRWVARALTEAGAEVWLTARDGQRLQAVCDDYGIRGHIRIADLADPGAFTRMYEEIRPVITFNLAGYGVRPQERDPELSDALNVRLVAEMMDAIGRSQQPDWGGLRLVHAGSAFEYGPVKGTLTEQSLGAPTNLYGKTKLTGTQQLLAGTTRAEGRAVVARLFTVYGPGEHLGRLLPSLLRLSGTTESLPLTAGQQERDFTYVEDIAEGLLRLGLLPEAPGIVNLATGKLTSVREFAECAARIASLRPEQIRFGALPTRPDEPPQGSADISLLERLLAWRPGTSFEEGITKTFAFTMTHKVRG